MRRRYLFSHRRIDNCDKARRGANITIHLGIAMLCFTKASWLTSPRPCTSSSPVRSRAMLRLSDTYSTSICARGCVARPSPSQVRIFFVTILLFFPLDTRASTWPKIETAVVAHSSRIHDRVHLASGWSRRKPTRWSTRRHAHGTARRRKGHSTRRRSSSTRRERKWHARRRATTRHVWWWEWRRHTYWHPSWTWWHIGWWEGHVQRHTWASCLLVSQWLALQLDFTYVLLCP